MIKYQHLFRGTDSILDVFGATQIDINKILCELLRLVHRSEPVFVAKVSVRRRKHELVGEDTTRRGYYEDAKEWK